MTKQAKIWKLVIYKTGIWLAAEIWLNLIGLDDLADYSDFVFVQSLDSNPKNCRAVKATDYPPMFCPRIHDFCPIPKAITNPTDLEVRDYPAKAKIFKSKCQKLAEVCYQVASIPSNPSPVSLH
jgi:hypothetical protein